MTLRARLIHPVLIALRLATLPHSDSATPPVTLLAQVAWQRYGTTGLHAHIPTSLYAGSLTFLAASITPFLQTNSLVRSQILTIAGYDYADAMLVINHIVPMAHRGSPHLIKAFFSAEVVSLEHETEQQPVLDPFLSCDTSTPFKGQS